MSEELKPFADTAATEMQRMFALSSDLEKQNKTLKAENERLKQELRTLQIEFYKQREKSLDLHRDSEFYFFSFWIERIQSLLDTKKENGDDAPDNNVGRKTETNGEPEL